MEENTPQTMTPENSEYSENSESSETSQPSDIARLIAEAEERGYQRALSEQTAAAPDDSDDSCPSFLAHIRPGFWD